LTDVLGVADTTTTVLLLGETGTGKELLAQALHAASPRQTRPFVTVNCATLSPTRVLSQLFGHERGAFTGADMPYVGCFERAHTGTLFLDEIGSLALEVQGVLLRVLQEHRIQRVGSEQTLRVDVRIVAATNQPLRERVWARAFREDLFYRLNVVPIEILNSQKTQNLLYSSIYTRPYLVVSNFQGVLLSFLETTLYLWL
jgi:Nif-specific regulatory protein